MYLKSSGPTGMKERITDSNGNSVENVQIEVIQLPRRGYMKLVLRRQDIM